jgi:GNAT superfamily N-acetyltransferase
MNQAGPAVVGPGAVGVGCMGSTEFHGKGPALPGTDQLIRVRRATTGDREALTRMFDRCAVTTRYRRFHGPVTAIPERYLADALSGSPFHHALVACLEPDSAAVPDPVAAPCPVAAPDSCAVPDPDARAGGIVALASCRTVDEGAAELGILIEDAWQRNGLGTRLLRDLATHAGDAGLRFLEAQVLAEQAWITGLLRPYGPCRLRSTWDGVLNVTVRLTL